MVKQNPLSWNVPIVDPKTGMPSPEFMRKWALQTQINGTIPVLSTSAEVSAVLDVIGSTRGAFLERGASGWGLLVPGTSGYVLKSAGTGADPVWASISSILDTISSTRGTILYRGASGWAALAPGTANYVLQTGGAGADPSWVAQSGGGGGGGVDLFSPPTAASFPTLVSASTATPVLTDTGSYGLLFDSGASISSTAMTAALKTKAGSTWTITAGVRLTLGNNNYHGGGICVTDGTKYVYYQIQWNSGACKRYVNYMGSPTSYSSTPFSGPNNLGYQSQVYLRLKDDGTNLNFYYSHDGRNYILDTQLTVGAFLGSITSYGLCMSPQASSTPPAVGAHDYMAVFYWADTSP